MQVQAKFLCVAKTQRRALGWWDPKTQDSGDRFVYEYEFQAVTGDSEENKEFFASTPSGHIQLQAVRQDLFEPGKEYYLNFTPSG